MECEALNHNYIGTEHLLLALTHTQNRVIDLVLNPMGLWKDVIRREVLSILGHGT